MDTELSGKMPDQSIFCRAEPYLKYGIYQTETNDRNRTEFKQVEKKKKNLRER
jgi:hypothetical protein